MSDYRSERDAAAEKHSTWIRYPLRADGTTAETKHSDETRSSSFKAGWDAAITQSTVVKGLVDALECNKTFHSLGGLDDCEPCKSKNAYTEACAQIEGGK